MTEAIAPMKKEIFNSLPKVRKKIEKIIETTGRDEKILIIGVGNSSGIGNDKNVVEDVKKVVRELDKRYKKEREEKKNGS